MVVKPVDPLAVQARPAPSGSRPGPASRSREPDLRGRGRLRIDNTAANNLTHGRVEREPVSSGDVLVSGQAPEHRLPEQPVELVGGVLGAQLVAQRDRSDV